ncbi:MAG: TIM barrel protein [Limnobacter sp.]|nr:TIM barrel protein [Limnobacter sp.]
MKFAANLSLMYNEWDFLDRIKAAAEDGFRFVECMFPYEHDDEKIRQVADDAGVSFVLINAPPGNWSNGDRGLAALAERRGDFEASIPLALRYAKTLGVSRVHVLAGCPVPELKAEAAVTYLGNLRQLQAMRPHDQFCWLIEPLNQRDVPGYLLSSQAQAHDWIEQCGNEGLGVQMDLYHCQVSEGDIVSKLKAYLPTGRVKHLQIAGAPERLEPDLGELNYSRIFQELELLNYNGFVGCEYKPKANTRDGLGWRENLGISGKM